MQFKKELNQTPVLDQPPFELSDSEKEYYASYQALCRSESFDFCDNYSSALNIHAPKTIIDSLNTVATALEIAVVDVDLQREEHIALLKLSTMMDKQEDWEHYSKEHRLALATLINAACDNDNKVIDIDKTMGKSWVVPLTVLAPVLSKTPGTAMAIIATKLLGEASTQGNYSQGMPASVARNLLFDISGEEDFARITRIKLSPDALHFVLEKYQEKNNGDLSAVKTLIKAEVKDLQNTLAAVQKPAEVSSKPANDNPTPSFSKSATSLSDNLANIKQNLTSPAVGNGSLSVKTRENIYKALQLASSVANCFDEYQHTKAHNSQQKAATKQEVKAIERSYSRGKTRKKQQQHVATFNHQCYQPIPAFQTKADAASKAYKKEAEAKINQLAASIINRTAHLKSLSHQEKKLGRYLKGTVGQIKRHNHHTSFLDHALPAFNAASQVAGIFLGPGVPALAHTFSTIFGSFNQGSKKRKENRNNRRIAYAKKVQDNLDLFSSYFHQTQSEIYALENQKECLEKGLMGNRSLWKSNEYRSKLRETLDNLREKQKINRDNIELSEKKGSKLFSRLIDLQAKIDDCQKDEKKKNYKVERSNKIIKLENLETTIEDLKNNNQDLQTQIDKTEKALDIEETFKGLNDWWDQEKETLKGTPPSQFKLQVLAKIEEYQKLTAPRRECMQELLSDTTNLINAYAKLGGKGATQMVFASRVASACNSMVDSFMGLNKFKQIVTKAADDQNIEFMQALKQLGFSTITLCAIHPALAGLTVILQILVARKEYFNPSPTLLQSLNKLEKSLVKKFDKRFTLLSDLFNKHSQTNHLALKALHHLAENNFKRLYEEIRRDTVQIIAQVAHIEQQIGHLSQQQSSQTVMVHEERIADFTQQSEDKLVKAIANLRRKKVPHAGFIAGLVQAISHSSEPNYNGIFAAQSLPASHMSLVKYPEDFSGALAGRLAPEWAGLPNVRLYLSLIRMVINYLDEVKQSQCQFPEHYLVFCEEVVTNRSLDFILQQGYALQDFTQSLLQPDWLESIQSGLMQQLSIMLKEVGQVIKESFQDQSAPTKVLSFAKNKNKRPLENDSEQYALLDELYTSIRYKSLINYRHVYFPLTNYKILSIWSPVDYLSWPFERSIFEYLTRDKARRYSGISGYVDYQPVELLNKVLNIYTFMEYQYYDSNEPYDIKRISFNTSKSTMTACEGIPATSNDLSIHFSLDRNKEVSSWFETTIEYNDNPIAQPEKLLAIIGALNTDKRLYFNSWTVKKYLNASLANYEDFAAIIEQINDQPAIKTVNDYGRAYPKSFHDYQKKYHGKASPFNEKNQHYLFNSIVIHSADYGIPLVIPDVYLQNLMDDNEELALIRQAQKNGFVKQLSWEYNIHTIENEGKQARELTLSCQVITDSGRVLSCVMVRVAVFDSMTMQALQEENGLPQLMLLGNNTKGLLPCNLSHVVDNHLIARVNRPFAGLYAILQHTQGHYFAFDWQIYTDEAETALHAFAKDGSSSPAMDTFFVSDNRLFALPGWDQFLSLYYQQAYEQNRDLLVKLAKIDSFQKAKEQYCNLYETLISLMVLCSDKCIQDCEMQLYEAGICHPCHLEPLSSSNPEQYSQCLEKMLKTLCDKEAITNFFEQHLYKSQLYTALFEQLGELEAHKMQMEAIHEEGAALESHLLPASEIKRFFWQKPAVMTTRQSRPQNLLFFDIAYAEPVDEQGKGKEKVLTL